MGTVKDNLESEGLAKNYAKKKLINTTTFVLLYRCVVAWKRLRHAAQLYLDVPALMGLIQSMRLEEIRLVVFGMTKKHQNQHPPVAEWYIFQSRIAPKQKVSKFLSWLSTWDI